MKVLTLIAAAATLATGVSAPSDAEARTSEKRMKQCEQAVRGELGAGSIRIKRIRSIKSGGETMFWMTVRHKPESASKSTRYRVTCEVNEEQQASLELEQGWWKTSPRGRAPVAVD